MKKTSLLLIGSGRLARHLEYYFTKKSIVFQTWTRRQKIEHLPAMISASSHVLLAISDSALSSFINENLLNSGKIIVHFSGALSVEGAIAAHPLMSFGPHFYKLEDYERIHFVLTGCERLPQVLPGLKNSFTVLSAENKALYHAACVLGGNFPVLLWQKMTEVLGSLGLPEEAHQVYLEKVVENFNRHGVKALTGPLVRKDLATIRTNLNALANDPFQKVYEAFAEAYK